MSSPTFLNNSTKMTETLEGNAPTANKPLRIEMLEHQLEPNVGLDGDSTSPELLETDPKLVEHGEEEVHAVVGPSIGRAQTYMLSPTTPAAEKAAALAESGDKALFDRALESLLGQQEGSEHNDVVEDIPQYDGSQTPPPPPAEKDGMPSPWRATPKKFERETSQVEQPVGSMGFPTDINFKKYISNLNLPLPKAPSFKDFSVPSLASVFGSVRDHSPLRKGARQKRASTIDSRSGYPLYAADDSIRDETTGSSAATITDVTSSSSQDAAEARPGRQGSSDARPLKQYPRPLHKATSDQSLMLRRAGSTKSSLGDDSRWAAVHEQVNSRRKAIMDSLQDSKFPRPSIPDLPSFNLAAFRPDFLRTRADIDAKADSTRNLVNESNSNSEPREMRESAASMLKTSKTPDMPENIQVANKVTSNTLSCFDQALEDLTGDIVVMGGYRGSILRSATPPHRQQWVPVKVGLNIRKVNLELGLEPEDEENADDTIIAGGMLSHIGPVDMGRRLLKRLKSCKNVMEGRLRVHDYGYDWRLSPHLLSRRLIGFLENLESNASDVPAVQRGVWVIAHSMGGLITRHAVNRRPELFAGVVYAGVPQHCVNILGPLRNGDDVLLSSKVLTAQVNFTMRSTFLLLPDDGRCFIDKETKEEYPVDFFDVGQWIEHAFSPCLAPIHPPFSGEPKKGLLESLSNSLPSLPSLPLPARKGTPPSQESKQQPPQESTITKLSHLTDPNPATARSLDPHFTPTTTPSNNTTLSFEDAHRYLSRTLNSTTAFRSELHHQPPHQLQNRYPPLALIYATNTPTVSRARVSCRAAIRCTDAYDDLQFGSGDGVCLARAAQLPEGYVVATGGRVRTERGHVGLLGDLEGVGRCLGAVLGARKKGAGLGLEDCGEEVG